jgi:regulator of sigma E protease
MDFFATVIHYALTAIAFLFIFSGLILIHEWGHFFAARKSGIKVEEFGFGLPPRLWGFKKGETLYSLNAIPFGGFVRLLGEDSSDPKANKNPRSFSVKPAWIKMLVVLAGVLMNFLLAFLLLTIGFVFGTKPLILNGDDLLDGIQHGTVQIQTGITVQSVKPGSAASEAGIMPGDILLTLNGNDIAFAEQIDDLQKSTKALTLGILRDHQQFSLNLTPRTKEEIGIYTPLFLPRLQIHSLDRQSVFYQAGLRSGDILLKINNKDIYGLDSYLEIFEEKPSQLSLMLLREEEIYNFQLTLPQDLKLPFVPTDTVVISKVFPGSPASKAGFQFEDTIVSIEGNSVASPQQFVDMVGENKDKELHITINRRDALNGIQMKEMTVRPDKNGLIGVGLELMYSQNNQLVFFHRELPTSIVKINDISYPVWIAPIKAFDELVKLSVFTVQTFGDVIGSIFTRLAIPEGVAGPVGIFQMTSGFIQEGLFSLVRFMAVLSLSLAVINVLPLPALDGGRFLFILIEVVIGRKLNPKYEALIHAVGLVLFMMLILAVTYNDIVRIIF